MMTLNEARELVTPILKSESLRIKEVQEKIKEIRNMFDTGFDFSDGRQVLEKRTEEAFKELAAMHKGVDIFV